MVLRLLVIAGALAFVPTAAAGGASPVQVYFVRGEHAAVVHRGAPALTPAGAAVRSLLAGPTAGERREAISTAIPSGTRLLGLSIHRGVARVDLSKRFASGGGSASMTGRLAQLVYTLTAIRGVNAVELRLEGKPVSVFSGEGLILHQPLTRSAFPEFVP